MCEVNGKMFFIDLFLIIVLYEKVKCIVVNFFGSFVDMLDSIFFLF